MINAIACIQPTARNYQQCAQLLLSCGVCAVLIVYCFFFLEKRVIKVKLWENVEMIWCRTERQRQRECLKMKRSCFITEDRKEWS